MRREETPGGGSEGRRGGQRLDVTGTPTFFINGRVLTGAQPLEAFARMIDDELARSGR